MLFVKPLMTKGMIVNMKRLAKGNMKLLIGFLCICVILGGCVPKAPASDDIDMDALLNPTQKPTAEPGEATESPGSMLNSAVLPAPPVPDADKKTSYEIKGDFDVSNMFMNCTQTVDYYNGSNKTLNEVYFHNYPSAFKSKETAPFPNDEIDAGWVYPTGFDPGSMIMSDVTINGEDISFDMQQDNQIMRVPLKTPLAPGQRVQMDMTFSIKIPLALSTFGYGPYTVQLGSWYPIACAFDGDGWHLNPYYKIGNPFYSDIADFQVTIVTIPQVQLYAPGTLDKTEGDARTTWAYTAENMRDFALCASNPGSDLSYAQASTMLEADGVIVTSYYNKGESEEFGKKVAQIAANALLIYNRRFGMYPYKTLDLVQTDCYFDGGSYPGLIMLDSAVYKKVYMDQLLEPMVAAMVAQQWWGGVVGVDQANEDWLCVGLAEYGALIYQNDQYGAKVRDIMYSNNIVNRRYLPLLNNQGWTVADEVIARNASEFSTVSEYDGLVRGKAVMMFKQLHDQLGDGAFFKSMSDLYQRFGYKHATQNDMVQSASVSSSNDLTAFFHDWLMGVTVPPEAQ